MHVFQGAMAQPRYPFFFYHEPPIMMHHELTSRLGPTVQATANNPAVTFSTPAHEIIR
ncbi:hypothetical protein DM02DRAFT_425062 [Periconia macrospinosa]|uniref:Uncharacterized protein n=1 Tax=Periconia macrospinosa TaxID=97972 RepID=A0A2V1E7N9_9PLEO|nr:hypothetical protein DM02DRAFT_425062 [Periconia macrospinosa]